MVSDIRKQIMNGYTKTQEAICNGRLRNWVDSDSENENKGALAAMTFYGACIRECMSRGLDNSFHVHMLSSILVSLIEDDELDDVLLFIVGKPLSPKLLEMIKTALELYKVDYQSVIDQFLNIKIEVEFGDEQEEIGFGGDEDDEDTDDDDDIIIS
jgi:hypothetical protein